MSILDQIEKELYHCDFKKMKQQRDFWRLSYKTDENYIDGYDAKGDKILVKVPCEENKEYHYRKQITTPRNHCGIIIDRYTGFVFRKSPRRSEETQTYLDFLKNADINNNSLDTVMNRALKSAQIDGFSLLVADTTASVGLKTLAQAKAENSRPFIRIIPANTLINWSINDGELTEALVAFVDSDGFEFLRYYNNEIFIDFRTDGKRITGIVTEETEHGYGDIPIVMLSPNLPNSSQIAPLAELQKSLTNKLSLKEVESTSSIYTQHLMKGQLPELDENGNVPANIGGNNRIIYMGPDADFTRLGADTAASSDLREDIKNIEESIYRISGLASSNPFQVGAPQSGTSKAFDSAQAGDIARALADAAEQSENKIIDLIFQANYGYNPAQAVYDKEFTITPQSDAVNNLGEILALDIPQTLKDNSIKSFANSYYSLNEEEQEQFEQELSGETEEEIEPTE